jgi:putative inorganic carbon (HCO3(-)) transporter
MTDVLKRNPSWVLCAGAVAAIIPAAIAAIGPGNATAFTIVIGLIALASVGYLVWHGNPAWTFSAAIVLSVFGGNWSYMGWPGALPITPDRLLLLGGLATVVVNGPGARQLPRIQLRPIHWLMAATLVFALGSALVAGTLFSNSAFFRLFDRFGVAPFAAFLVAPAVFSRESDRRVFLAALVLLGGYLGLTALFETAGPKALVFPRYILDPTLGFQVGRARGPFLEAEANGIALFFCGTAAALAAVAWRGVARMLAVGVVALCVLGCVFTLQRAVWAGAGIGVLTTLLSFRALRAYFVPALAALTVLVIGALLVVPGLRTQVGARTSDQHSLWDRTNLNVAAIHMVEAKPLLGFGWGRFAADSPPYFWQQSTTPLTAVGAHPCTSQSLTTDQQGQSCTEISHNSYLSNAAELGLVGATLWLACIVFAIGAAIVTPLPGEFAPWRMGLLAITVMWAVVAFFTPLEGPFSPVVLWLWAGLVWAGSHGHGFRRSPSRAPEGQGGLP